MPGTYVFPVCAHVEKVALPVPKVGPGPKLSHALEAECPRLYVQGHIFRTQIVTAPMDRLGVALVLSECTIGACR